MTITPGTIITSAPSMDDPHFRDSIICIAAYNEKGAMGFIVNQRFERPLNALVEFSSSPAFPLYRGGPVDTEHLFFMHRRNDCITGGTLIMKDLYLGGNFKAAIAHINNKTITTQDIKIFVGYCGWDAGELEAEIEEGSWIVEEENTGIVFSS